jgi:hypothetical protein
MVGGRVDGLGRGCRDGRGALLVVVRGYMVAARVDAFVRVY